MSEKNNFMFLHIVGSGNWNIKPDRSAPAFIVDTYYADNKLPCRNLVDCGDGTIMRLANLEMMPTSFDALHITHPHADHMGDMASFIDHRIMHGGNSEFGHRPFILTGPRGIKETWLDLHERFCSADLLTPDFTQSFKIQEFDEGECEPHNVGTCIYTPFVVNHIPGKVCLGYKFELAGKKLVFTGDIGPVNGQPTSFFDGTKNADLIVIEAGAKTSSKNHLTMGEAIDYGVSVAKQVVINHIPPDFLVEANHILHGYPADIQERVRIAQDDMKITI
ncbi:MAG: ribonuclease Z [Candidatus Andersenbacteria bacterium]|nr:ribonuclease Z [Candidatus Andersenbacteria bacterium]